jgi:spoIIIJ-associated protein
LPAIEVIRSTTVHAARLCRKEGKIGTLRAGAHADAVLVDVPGSELGLLLGPSGVTLSAIEELTRAAVLHRAGGSGARINVDVAGYRAKRREALAAFTTQLAEQVKETGVAKALEPMSAADRKVVHDTCAEIDGVGTTSEGEDQRRRVVISPA